MLGHLVYLYFEFVKFQAERVIPDSRPSRGWPHQGVVLFDNFQLRYRDGLPLVLKEISFMIKPAEKVLLVTVLKEIPSLTHSFNLFRWKTKRIKQI